MIRRRPEIAEAGSGAEAIAAIRGFDPDLVFLDVQMPDMDGFAVLAAVPERRFHVVFLTAHDHHALRAFEAEALDYLLKPVDPERFERALERARQQVAARAPAASPQRFLRRLLVENNGREIFLPVEQLDWAEAVRNNVVLHAGRETYTIRGTLESLARQLDPEQFARISRSALINLDSVKEMQPWFHGERRTILKDGTSSPGRGGSGPLRPANRPARSLRGWLFRAIRATIGTCDIPLLRCSSQRVSPPRMTAGPLMAANAGGTRYSPLKQVTRANVDKLKVAWTYHTGALQPETRLNQKAAFEATPILVDGVAVS